MKTYLLNGICFFVLAIFGVVLFTSPSISAQEFHDHIPGQILVKFKENIASNLIEAELARYNAKILDQVQALNVLVITVPEKATENVLNALSKSKRVEYAELNYVAHAILTPNDPYFADNQWGLENTGNSILGQTGTSDADIDGPTAWDTSMGSSTLAVAILDTGIDQDHEDLSGKTVLNKNFTDSSTVDDVYGHGTHVGGIVAAVTNNNVGVAGGCPACVVMNVKVLNDSGSGAYSWIANGITYSADNGAKVINMSLGGNSPSRTLERAVNYAWNKGVVLTAAAGNSGSSSRTYPAYYSKVVAVAATDNNDKKASFSNYGKWVDVAAPGVNIFSTFPNHDFTIGTKYGRSKNYDFASGTSMATPMTAAVAALIWTTPYGTSNTSVRNRLEKTADDIPGTGTYWSAGRVNAANAVAQ